MLHITIHSAYVEHRKLFSRLLRGAFALAGVFWFLLYAMPADLHTEYRSTQSLIYFILLSVWGIDALRESKRLSIVCRAANQKKCSPNQVEIADVAEYRSLFNVSTVLLNGKPQVLVVVLWGALAVAIGFIAFQYVRGVAALWV